MEVICISSDDESASHKGNKKNQSSVVSFAKSIKSSHVQEKLEVLSDDEKVKGNKLKRKISQVYQEEKTDDTERKTKLKDRVSSEIVNKEFASDSKSDGVQLDNQLVTIKRPKLVVKEKKKISYIAHNIFPLFISLCLQKSQNGTDKEDMEKIVTKLKRRYENMDPVYANSKSFTSFLNEKRGAIMNNGTKKYVYIEEVMNQMKSKKKSQMPPQNSEHYDAVPSTSYVMNNPVNSTMENPLSDENDNENIEDPHTRKKIKQLRYAMAKCEAMIKKLEIMEVDFETENDSNYIKVERYKQRMVELFNKLCELTQENTDAGRAYLRPKHFSTTRIVAVDQAITNFINAKITMRNKMKKNGRLTDDLIFPDYRDILECVNRCNDKKNLGLDQKRQKHMARKAFRELGEYLQRARRNDYWDTFSLFLENTEEDPALKDKDLAKKLTENRIVGDKKLAAVFQTFTRKQEEMKEQDITEEDEEEDEEEEEEEENTDSIDEDNNKDLVFSTSDENDDDEDVNKTLTENGSIVRKNKTGTSILTDDHNTDQNSNESTDRVDPSINMPNMPHCKQGNVKIPVEILKEVKERETITSDKNKTMNDTESTQEPCTDDVAMPINICTDTKKQKSDISSSAADCTNSINRIKENQNEVITEMITDLVTQDTKQDVVDITADLTISKVEKTATMQTKIRTSPERITKNKTADTMIVKNRTKVITKKAMELIEIDIMDTPCKNAPRSKQVKKEKEEKKMKEEEKEEEKQKEENEEKEEEKQKEEEKEERKEEKEKVKKPQLRVRSFAKPPTTWEDNQHKEDELASEPKVTNRSKDVIDLTTETITTTTTTTITTKPMMTTMKNATKPPPLMPIKYNLQLGNRVVPLVKQQTVLVPGKNVINVQNITNNYLKMNKRTGQIIVPTSNACDSMIIRLPSVASMTNQQNQSQNANAIATRNEVSLKRNETIVRIVQPKKPIVLSQKPTVQFVCNQTSSNPSTTKPK